MSELTALYQDRKSTCYRLSGRKIVISSKSAQRNSLDYYSSPVVKWNVFNLDVFRGMDDVL